MEAKANRKEQKQVLIEIENCRQNIEFYRDQIGNMEEKISELEKLKESFEYY